MRQSEAALHAPNARREQAVHILQGDRNGKTPEELEAAIAEELKRIGQIGAAVTAEDEQHLVDMHIAWVKKVWGEDIYSVEAHRNLIQVYVGDGAYSDGPYKNYYDNFAGEGATEYLAGVLYRLP